MLAACPPWKMLALMLLVCLKSQPRIAAMSDKEAAQLEREQHGGTLQRALATEVLLGRVYQSRRAQNKIGGYQGPLSFQLSSFQQRNTLGSYLPASSPRAAAPEPEACLPSATACWKNPCR